MYAIDKSYTLAVCERIAQQLVSMARETPGAPVRHWLIHGTALEFVFYNEATLRPSQGDDGKVRSLADRAECRARIARADTYPYSEMATWRRAAVGGLRAQTLDSQMFNGKDGIPYFAVRFMWSIAPEGETLPLEPPRPVRPRRTAAMATL